MRNQKFNSSSAKGYYIALILCAVAIGISGYLYYTNARDNTLEVPDVSVGATVEGSETDNRQPTATVPSQTKPQTATKPMKTGIPLSGETVAQYAMDCLSYNPTTRDWRVHNGIDIAAEAGSTVCAAADGTVYTVFSDDKLGTTVVLRHENGYTTQYSSLSDSVSVKPGDTVKLGQALGTVGQTALLESAIGEHLHFAVSCNDQPVDPVEFLPQN